MVLLLTELPDQTPSLADSDDWFLLVGRCGVLGFVCVNDSYGLLGFVLSVAPYVACCAELICGYPHGYLLSCWRNLPVSRALEVIRRMEKEDKPTSVFAVSPVAGVRLHGYGTDHLCFFIILAAVVL